MSRLFIAAYPPPLWARAAVALVEGPGAPAGSRVVDTGMVHLTLLFIGDTPPGDVMRVRESVDGAAAGVSPFTLRPMGLVRLPQRGPPRLIAVECEASSPASELHHRLVARLVHRRTGRSGNGFLPHLTVCRLQPGSSWESGGRADPVLTEFRVEQICLVRSDLSPSGAVHTIVHRSALRTY